MTTNRALYSLLWRCISRARQLSPCISSKIGLATSARKRVGPPLPDDFFPVANFYAAMDIPVSCLLNEPLSTIARSLQTMINSLNSFQCNHILNWISSQPCKLGIQPSFHSFLGPDIAFTSWTHMNMYGIDFGFGPPKRIRLPRSHWDGLVIVMDGTPSSLPTRNCETSTSSEYGLEVYIGLEESAMSRLLKDEELCKYAHFSKQI